MRKVEIKNSDGSKTYTRSFDKLNDAEEAIADSVYVGLATAYNALFDGRNLTKLALTEYTVRDIAIDA